MAASPGNTAIGTGMILTGVPVYFLFIYWKNKPRFIKKILGEFYSYKDFTSLVLSSGVVTEFLQKILIVLPKDQ